MQGVQAGREGEVGLASDRGGSSPPGALSRPGCRWAVGGLREVMRAGGGLENTCGLGGKGRGLANACSHYNTRSPGRSCHWAPRTGAATDADCACPVFQPQEVQGRPEEGETEEAPSGARSLERRR